MAAQQRRLAHASKRDSTAMKTLSLLGAIFLPGTFLSSVFSMTFFQFDVRKSQILSRPHRTFLSNFKLMNIVAANSEVSQELWIYFAVTIPLTVAIVGAWWLLDRRREKAYAEEDIDIEQGIARMETDILAIMRKRTMKSTATWDSGMKSPTSMASPQHHHPLFLSLEKGNRTRTA